MRSWWKRLTGVCQDEIKSVCCVLSVSLEKTVDDKHSIRQSGPRIVRALSLHAGCLPLAIAASIRRSHCAGSGELSAHQSRSAGTAPPAASSPSSSTTRSSSSSCRCRSSSFTAATCGMGVRYANRNAHRVGASGALAPTQCGM
jgi:hypothetical protein